MKFQEYLEEMKKELEKSIKEESGRSVKITQQQVTKNNGVILTGLSIMEKGDSIAPTIYMNEEYQRFLEHQSMEYSLRNVLKQYEQFRLQKKVDVSFISDFEQMKDYIVYRLVSLERNTERLKEMPYFQYLDLAVVFYCQVSTDKNCNAAIPIYNKHMKMWKTDKDELLKLAKDNTPRLFPCELTSMHSMISEIIKESGEEEQEMWEELSGQECMPMYILSNTYKFNGASVILYQNVLRDFAVACNRNFYLLPSSIHEVILVPEESGTTLEELTQMVMEVNQTQVEEEEVLSDHAYYFDKETMQLVI